MAPVQGPRYTGSRWTLADRNNLFKGVTIATSPARRRSQNTLEPDHFPSRVAATSVRKRKATGSAIEVGLAVVPPTPVPVGVNGPRPDLDERAICAVTVHPKNWRIAQPGQGDGHHAGEQPGL